MVPVAGHALVSFLCQNINFPLTAMRPIWSLALACLTTKNERILISYKFFHINCHEADLVFGLGLPHKIKNFDET